MREQPFKLKGFVVWGVCALFYLYEFSLRTILGTYQQPVMQTLHLNAFQFSMLSTAVFFLVYGLMQIPAGLIIDQIGLKRSLLIASICCALASLGFASSQHFTEAIVFRVLTGLGASFGFVSLLIAVHDWMPHRYSGVFIGLSQLIGTLGPMFVAGPLASMSASSGISWRTVFMGLSMTGVVLTILVFFFVENSKKTAGDFIILHKPERISVSLLRLFDRWQPWVVAICSAALYFTVEYFSDNEGRNFLILKGANVSSASYMITISWIGYAIACPLMGFLSDLLEKRKIVMVGTAIIGLVAICTILYGHSQGLMPLAFFAMGFAASGESVGFAAMAEQFKSRFVAIGFGLNNAVITTVVALNAPVIGYWLDAISGPHQASLHDYLIVFRALVVVSIVALLLAAFWVKETFCKSTVELTVLKNRVEER